MPDPSRPGYRPLPIGQHLPTAKPSIGAPSVAIMATELLRFGTVQMAPSHPLFRSGPVPGDMVVFPRAPFLLAREGDRTRTVDATVALTYFARQAFERRASTSDGTRAHWIAISPSVRDELCRLSGTERFPATALPVTRAQFFRAQRIFAWLRIPGIDPLAVEEGALELVFALFAPSDVLRGNPAHGHARDAHRDLVERARLILARDVAANPTLHEITTQLGASPGHLCRTFRAVTGLTMRSYRRELRMRLALHWLDDTNHDLARVALELGFANHAHFTLWFRRLWGQTPSAHRRTATPSSRRRPDR